MQIQNALLTGSTTVYGPITFVSGSIIGSSSYAATSSYADTFTVAGSLTAQTLVVQTITSSVSFITGSTRFGSLQTNTHTFTGSLQVTGSGPHTVFGNVQMGNTTSVETATPVILSLGGTVSNTPGANVKLRVYDHAGNIGGMSVSSGQTEVHTWSAGKLAFYRGTTQSAIIDTGGNLGIGTATPVSRLHVETSSVSNGNILTLRNSAAWSTPMMTSIAIRDASNDVGAIGWRYNAAGTTVDMHIHSLYNSAYTNINNIVMTVRGNGNVGIGTVLPNASLHVSGSNSGSLMQISSHASSNIFFVSGSGNVGIGTATPTERLDVIGGAVAAGNGTIRTGITYSSLGLIGTFTNHDLGVITNGSEKMRITSAGSVTIGSNLQFDSNGDFYQKTTGGAAIWSATANVTYPSYGFYGNTGIGMYRASADVLAFTTSASERMRITSVGNVGIGTSTVTEGTQAAGSISIFPSSSVSSAPLIQFPGNGRIRPASTGDRLSIDGNALFLNGTFGANIVMATGGGNVGIGTTSINHRLQISPLATYGNAEDGNICIVASPSGGTVTSPTTMGGIIFGDNTVTNGYMGRIAVIQENPSASTVSHMRFYTNNGGGNGATSERMRITSGGNLLIGKTAASVANVGCELNGNGTATFAFAITSNEAVIYNNTTTGTTYQIDFRTNSVERGSISVTDSATAFNTTSDYRIKEDFKQFNGLEKLANIKVYDFKFKDLEERMDGVIAHELQEILPYAVTGVKDGTKFQSVDYSKLVPVLVKSIQELSTKLDEATTRIKTLESR